MTEWIGYQGEIQDAMDRKYPGFGSEIAKTWAPALLSGRGSTK
jgi:hypothetical protein